MNAKEVVPVDPTSQLIMLLNRTLDNLRSDEEPPSNTTDEEEREEDTTDKDASTSASTHGHLAEESPLRRWLAYCSGCRSILLVAM